MKAKMKKYGKVFWATLFSTVLVIAMASAFGRVPITTEDMKTATSAIIEGGPVSGDVSVSQNYFVEPLTDANYLAVASMKDVGDLKSEVPILMSNDADNDVDFSGTADYYIETMDQWNEFVATSKENSYANSTVHLATDIQWDGTDFAGIGSLEVPFAGTFDGHGYAITKLYSTTNGLFVAVEGATIQNLAIGSAKVAVEESTEGIGVLIGHSRGATVENVVISSSKITTAKGKEMAEIGGMIGSVSGDTTIFDSKISRLTIKSEVMVFGAGGFVGKTDASLTIQDCDIANSYLKNTVVAEDAPIAIYLGGVVGWATAPVNATEVNAVAMNLQVASPAKGMGTMAGYLTGTASTFEKCSVDVSNLSMTTGENISVGGFAGWVESPSVFKNSFVSNAKVNAKGNGDGIGGFIGNAASVDGVTLTSCFVKSTTVSGKTWTGEVVGKNASANSVIGAAYYYGVTISRADDAEIYTCDGIAEASLEAIASGELAWNLNTVNGTVANSKVWSQGNGPRFVTNAAKATVRVAFVQPSGTVYCYTDSAGNLTPPEVDDKHVWPEISSYDEDMTVEAESLVNELGELGLTGNYFQETENGAYVLTSNSDSEGLVDNVTYEGVTLQAANYSIKGKITLNPSEDWAQSRILVSIDPTHEHVFAMERVDGTNYQIFTMSKNNETWWNDWRLISSSLINGNKNSIDFEIIAIGAKVYFLMNDEICYSSDRVNMEESIVKFSSYKNATTTVEGLQGQIFLQTEDAEEYLATKNEKAYASGYQPQINDRYNKYFVQQDCTGKGGTLILGHSHMDPYFWSNWEKQMGLVDGVSGYNVGIGGTTTKDWIYAYDKLVKPFGADRFIISVGENDVCVWGSDGDEVVARLKVLFEMIHADHPDAEIYYIYSLPAATKYVNGQWLDVQYKALVDGEKALCESLDYVQGIDTFNVLVDANTGNAKTELYGANNDIHLNSDGYLLWSDYLYGEIFGGEQSFNTNLTGWTATGGNWTVTRRGLGATNSYFGDQFYMSNTSLSARQSWAFEADIVLEQGVAGGLIFGAKDPTNPARYLFGVNSNKLDGQFKHYKGGDGVQGWYEGIDYGELANTNAYHFRVEYDVKKGLITYKMAPYGTENYVVTQTWPETELTTYDGQIYFGLVTFYGTVTFDNVMLEPLYPEALTFDENGNAVVEAEHLAIAGYSGANQIVQGDMSSFGQGVWSNNEQLAYIANGTDNYVRFYLNIAEEGDYDLSAAFTKFSDFGIYQHYIDGEPVGGNIDLYINDIWGNYALRTSEIYMGYAHLTPGVHVLEAKCVGKNNQSAGYVYGMDYLKVSKASTSHFYEAEDLTITNGTATYGFQGGINVCSRTMQFLQINNGVGDFVEFNVYINKDGYYDISAALTKAGDFSIVQHYIDGEKLGPAVDLYHGYYINPGETSLGHVYLKKGTHSIKALVVGKNEQSAGYVYGVDFFRVSEVAASSLSTYEYENTDLGVVAYHSSNSNPDNHVWTQGGNFSGGNQLLFFGAAAQDYVTVEVNVPKNGYYRLDAILCRAGDFGIVQHYVDDVKIGNPINNIEGGLVMAPAVIGEVYLTAGTHTLKAVMIASDSGAYPGYLYGLDKLTLQEVIPQNTTSWRVEGENLNVIASSDGIIPTNQKLWWFDSAAWSQGAQLLAKFYADNQSITVTFDIAEDGAYNLAVALGKFPDFGKFQFAIDGQNIGDVIDSYNGDVAHSGEVGLGNRYLQSGTHELTITCVGTSGSGRLLGLDYLQFNKISD